VGGPVDPRGLGGGSLEFRLVKEGEKVVRRKRRTGRKKKSWFRGGRELEGNTGNTQSSDPVKRKGKRGRQKAAKQHY